MAEPKVNIGVRVHLDLKHRIEEDAERDSRTVSNLCELLLGWAHEQFLRAGSWSELRNWTASPPEAGADAFEKQARLGRSVAQRHGERKSRRAG